MDLAVADGITDPGPLRARAWLHEHERRAGVSAVTRRGHGGMPTMNMSLRAVHVRRCTRTVYCMRVRDRRSLRERLVSCTRVRTLQHPYLLLYLMRASVRPRSLGPVYVVD